MKMYIQMTAKKSDDSETYKSIEILASELEKLDVSKLALFNGLDIKNYRGGVLDLRFLEETPSLRTLVVIFTVNDETSQVTTEEWILPTRPNITKLSLYGVQPDSSSIDTFSTWGLDLFALNRVNYKDCSHQHLNHLLAKRLVLRKSRLPDLPKIKHLESVLIDDCHIDKLDLNNISSNVLKTLDLDYRNLSNEHLEQIRQITSLEVLILKGLGKNGPLYPVLEGLDYSRLDGHPNLLRLDINGIKGAFTIPHLSSLESLSLFDMKSEEIDLSPLAESENLSALDIQSLDIYHQQPLSQLDLSPLSSCTRLKMLHISNTGVEEFDLTPLLHIETLDNLFIFDEPSPVLFADSRLKDNVRSPSIKSLDKRGKLEWRSATNEL
jgi:hypothetical protein